jgi:hypothetical protein
MEITRVHEAFHVRGEDVSNDHHPHPEQVYHPDTQTLRTMSGPPPGFRMSDLESKWSDSSEEFPLFLTPLQLFLPFFNLIPSSVNRKVSSSLVHFFFLEVWYSRWRVRLSFQPLSICPVGQSMFDLLPKSGRYRSEVCVLYTKFTVHISSLRKSSWREDSLSVKCERLMLESGKPSKGPPLVRVKVYTV